MSVEVPKFDIDLFTRLLGADDARRLGETIAGLPRMRRRAIWGAPWVALGLLGCVIVGSWASAIGTPILAFYFCRDCRRVAALDRLLKCMLIAAEIYRLVEPFADRSRKVGLQSGEA